MNRGGERQYRLHKMRKRGDFLATARGFFRAGPVIVVQMQKRNDNNPARAGFTATRRIGNAVRRNRARRRMKEAVRKLPENMLCHGCDYVFIARPDTATCPFNKLERQMRDILGKLNSGKGHPSHRRPRRANSSGSRP